MTAWCKMTPLPIVAVNTNYMLQDFKEGGHVGRSPHQLSARGAAEAEPHSGPFTLTVIRHVTRQVWVTGGLARGRGCSGSLPGGELLEHSFSSEEPWAGAGGCAGQGRAAQKIPNLLLCSGAEHGDSLAGCGNLWVDIRAINGQ